MAQFNHFDFGGSGQWMQGGMTMVSDLFNHQLKFKVDTLCQELATLYYNQTPIYCPKSLAEITRFNNWWPSWMGTPNASGSQNNSQYAFFQMSQRLAIKNNNTIYIYDSKDHNITGFSQQQGGGQDLSFSSQYGQFRVSQLALLSTESLQKIEDSKKEIIIEKNNQNFNQEKKAQIEKNDFSQLLEQLSNLYQKGILSEEEFKNKKAEILQRM